MQTWPFKTNQLWLEQNLCCAEPLWADLQLLAVWEDVFHDFALSASTAGVHPFFLFFLRIQCNVRDLLLDLLDNLLLCTGVEHAPTLP